jgi:hypothetical protein
MKLARCIYDLLCMSLRWQDLQCFYHWSNITNIGPLAYQSLKVGGSCLWRNSSETKLMQGYRMYDRLCHSGWKLYLIIQKFLDICILAVEACLRLFNTSCSSWIIAGLSHVDAVSA